MRRLQRLFLYLLCASLPVQGSAFGLALPAPCPMEAAMAAPMADAPGEHECCNHVDTAAETGTACKPGQDCATTSVGILTASPAAPVFPPAGARPLYSALPTAGFHPGAIWRPPTSL